MYDDETRLKGMIFDCKIRPKGVIFNAAIRSSANALFSRIACAIESGMRSDVDAGYARRRPMRPSRRICPSTPDAPVGAFYLSLAHSIKVDVFRKATIAERCALWRKKRYLDKNEDLVRESVKSAHERRTRAWNDAFAHETGLTQNGESFTHDTSCLRSSREKNFIIPKIYFFRHYDSENLQNCKKNPSHPHK